MPTPLDELAILERLTTTDGWQLESSQITKTYPFDTYLAGAAFAQRAAEVAESMNHHPDILILWRKVTLSISTHSAKGITDLDFKFAHAVDSPEGDAPLSP